MANLLALAPIVAVLGLTAWHAASPAITGQEPPAGCVPGVWDLQTTEAGAAAATTATSTHHCLFDGSVEMAEYRSFDPNGQLNFAGVSFHAWTADRRGLTTLWLMAGDPGHTIIPTTLDDQGRLVAAGWGEDRGGTFLERSITTFGPGKDYQFAMERSSDSGKTWQTRTDITGVFRTGTPPALSATLRDGLLAIRGSAPPATSLIILDGLAEVSTETATQNGRPTPTIRFSSAYGPAPGHWRTVVWQTGATTFITVPAR